MRSLGKEKVVLLAFYVVSVTRTSATAVLVPLLAELAQLLTVPSPHVFNTGPVATTF